MAKNIIVIDEQGNKHGVTYPKRAKGLIKNGRARFVDENTICLACPPEINLEENKMTNNFDVEQVIEITSNGNGVDKKWIFNQITLLQRDLQPLKDVLFQLQCVSESQSYCEQEDGEVFLREYAPDVALAKLSVIQEVFTSREQTINKMLDFYLGVWNDLDIDKE